MRALLALLTLCCACARPEAPAASVLRLLQVRPENPLGVYLDEELVLHFSAPLASESATSRSVRVVDETGRAARGRLRIEGAVLRFEPEPVLGRELDDGGFRPGTGYTLHLLGFPAPDGLRAATGEPLERSFSLPFRTVVRDGSTALFRPRPEERPRPLRYFPAPGVDLRYQIGPYDSIHLDCDLPLDPATFPDEAFELLDPEGRRVPLRVRLLENERAAAVRPRPARARTSGEAAAFEREPRAALVELAPRQPLSPGRHTLRLLPQCWSFRLRATRPPLGGLPPPALVVPRVREARPADTSGRPVWDRALTAVAIVVVERGMEGPRNLVLEEFLDTRLRSPVAVEGVDGTAAWRGDGRVTVRLPAAVGDGRAGDVRLVASIPDRDLHAVRIEVPADAEVALSDEPGLVVWRAQGSLRIQGAVTRRAGGGEASLPRSTTTLTAWLDQLETARANWTVLVAGGDLVVDGRLESSTPLLLVAGGMIRIGGTVVAGAEEHLFRLGEGGGIGFFATVPEHVVVDEPDENPLAATLVWAVRSGGIPQRETVAEWISAAASGSSSEPTRRGPATPATPRANGAWRLRWYAADGGGGGGRSDPRFLDPPGPARFQVELTVHPGGLWNPPFVDRVEASFEAKR